MYYNIMYYVYLIESTAKCWRYIGSTADLRRRFTEHNKGKVTSTKPHRPFKLVYYEAYSNKTNALKREIELKTNSQQKEILYKKLSDVS